MVPSSGRRKEGPVACAMDAGVVLDDTGEINQEFDRMFLDRVVAGRLPEFVAEWTPDRVEEVAGNGAQEVRNWITAAAVVDDGEALAGVRDAREVEGSWRVGGSAPRRRGLAGPFRA